MAAAVTVRDWRQLSAALRAARGAGTTAFLTTPQINTLPVYLYGSLQYGPSPAVYAAAAVVFVATLAMVGWYWLLLVLLLTRKASPTCRPPAS